jgi:transposase
MRRRRFTREFKVEAVKLVRERGVSVAQAAWDLDVHENVLRKWVKEFGSDPVLAFPGHGRRARPCRRCTTERFDELSPFHATYQSSGLGVVPAK